MIAPMARRLSVLAAGVMLIAAVAIAPTAVDASGVVVGPQSAVHEAPRSEMQPDLVVTPLGVTRDERGNTYYHFTIKNAGAGPAENVKVTTLYQLQEAAYPQKMKNTVTVRTYDTISAGQEQPVTILCEQSQVYNCAYGSVEVSVENPEASTSDNYASQAS